MSGNSIQNLIEPIKSVVDNRSSDVDFKRAIKSYEELKVQVPTALMAYHQDPTGAATFSLIKVVREALEYACLLQIRLTKIDEFEKCWCLLEPLYIDYAPPRLPLSEQKPRLYSLQLLKLLVDGERAGDFHTLLQRLSPEDWRHPDIKFVVELEQFLMSGNYEKSLEIINDPPNQDFVFLCKLLISSVRRSVADCLTKSHSEISVARAKQLLTLSSDENLQEFIRETNARYDAAAEGSAVQHAERDVLLSDALTFQPEDNTGPYFRWELKGDKIRFVAVNTKKSRCIPVDEIMRYVLGYAAELERIV